MRLASVPVATVAVGIALGAVLGAAPAAPRTVAGERNLRVFAFCPGGKTLAGGEREAGWLIDWPSGASHAAGTASGDSMPPCAAPALGFSPDGKWWAAVTDDDSRILLRDASGKEVQRLAAHVGTVYGAVFSPDGRYLASGGADNDVHIWDTKTWAMIKTIDSMTYTPFALAWAPDSGVLYVGGSSRTVMAFSTGSWSQIRSSAPQRFAIVTLAVSPDGRSLAAGSIDPDASERQATVLLFDAASLTERAAMPTPGPARQVAFSPDGHSVIALVGGQPGLSVWAVE
jgi:WD40 repeat protein